MKNTLESPFEWKYFYSSFSSVLNSRLPLIFTTKATNYFQFSICTRIFVIMLIVFSRIFRLLSHINWIIILIFSLIFFLYFSYKRQKFFLFISPLREISTRMIFHHQLHFTIRCAKKIFISRGWNERKGRKNLSKRNFRKFLSSFPFFLLRLIITRSV